MRRMPVLASSCLSARNHWKDFHEILSIFRKYVEKIQVQLKSDKREGDENCALLGYQAASSDHFLPTFQDNLSVPSSAVKNIATTRCVTTQNSKFSE
jgi:hypothetical protein